MKLNCHRCRSEVETRPGGRAGGWGEGTAEETKPSLVVNFGKGTGIKRVASGTRRRGNGTSEGEDGASEHGGGFGRMIGGTYWSETGACCKT